MEINYQTYLDKVHGGWLGKCLGGAAGAPVEGMKKVIETEHFQETLMPDLPNDDLDLQLLWLEVLQEKGFDIRAKDLAEAWDERCWYTFSEYGLFLKNYERGILPPESGTFNNPVFCEGEGSPIRSEIWGMCMPGNPEKAAYYAEMDSSLDHGETSIAAEKFYAAVEADAFFEEDLQTLIRNNLHYLGENTRPRKCAEYVLANFEENPGDWLYARTLLMRKFAHFDFTNSVTNLGIVLIALLYGNGDLEKIINIAYRCGYDVDCTCATAGSICGIILGASGIPDTLKALVKDSFVSGITLRRTCFSIRYLAEETCALGILGESVSGCHVENVPQSLNIPHPDFRRAAVEIDVSYDTRPAIGYDDSCEFTVHLVNRGKAAITQNLKLENLPEHWHADWMELPVTIEAGAEAEIKNRVQTDKDCLRIANTNLMTLRYGEYFSRFGIAGASLWKAAGPYFEALDKPETRTDVPSPHPEGCNLPTLECMVNNAAYLEKEYIDEKQLGDAILAESPEIINGYEDLLPLDDQFSCRGQVCVYLRQVVECPEERDVYFIVGNNDGFKIWLNQKTVMEHDEIRLCTPYNNFEIVHLKKGRNEIVAKVLRRTELFRFSFAIRRFNGRHYHQNRWCVDLISTLEEE